jgi:type I restriction enzyme R subunit
MTSTSSDPESWQIHNTSKLERKALANRLKDEDDELKLVIVRDMWLTGFDAPCLKTMYVDKPMQGHNLMQAIARVNRVYGEVEGGLIVDYIGMAQDLKKAIANYTQSGGQDKPVFDESEAIALMREKFEIVSQFYYGFEYNTYFAADTARKLGIILEAEDYILGLEDGKNRYITQVDLLSKAFALVITTKEAEIVKKEVAFFQAVKARLVKFNPSGIGKSGQEIETAIKQIVDEAVKVDGVVDVFDAAGIKKPEVSILSEEFLMDIAAMKQKNLAIELLKKLLNDEVRAFKKRNLVVSRKFSEMLKGAIKKYQNGLLSSAEIIEEMISIAKEIKEEVKRGESIGLSEYELAFYDALANNQSAHEVLGKEVLKEMAVALVDIIQKNATIDWNIRESARAKMRVVIKRLLKKYGYPPDLQKMAIDMVIEQAEMQIRGENFG